MLVAQFIAKQSEAEQELLTKIHELILKEDASVSPTIEPMMGMEMIIYKAGGTFKYGLASGKKHMSLHALPIYVLPELHDKYKALLKKAGFQKGCINFTSEEELPLPIVKQFIGDCSKVDLKKIREDQLKSKKKVAKPE